MQRHNWTNNPHAPWTFCRVCGVVKNEKNEHSAACKGAVVIKLRESFNADSGKGQAKDGEGSVVVPLPL